ncbi:MAG: hypothetical protein ACI8WB_000501 [Phenylobacterium sp.]|jgi:hypothetical protein
MLDRSILLKALKQQFPEITSLINAEQGLLHFEVTVFYQFTQSLINDGNSEKVKHCFNIANNYLVNGDKKVKNAISTSYAPCLDFNNTKKHKRGWAWDIYPQLLKQEYIIVHGQFGR